MTARCGNGRFPECLATDSVVVVAPTMTAVSSSGKTFGGLTKAEFISIIVGCLGVVVSTIGAYYTWKALR